MSAVHVDHVTQRVITNGFRSICEEMGHTMIRTANSSLFVEGRDFSCAIVDPEAELIAAANFDPSHLSAMALTVEFTIIYFGFDNVRPGDIYLVNDPYRGGGHLPDITLIRPIFVGDTLLGFAVNRAHHLDIGGMAVAGFPGTAHSIYQEGLRIPPVRWFAEGIENRDVIEMITLNMRFPKDQFGDFQAQLASTGTAERRLLKLAERYGANVVRACMEEAKDHSEELMRAVLRSIPDGCYSFTEFLDDDGATDQPYKIEVAVTISGDNVCVDYTGTSPQAIGPINSSYGNTLSSTFNAMLQLLGPEVPFNNGCFRPIEVLAPRGCLLNPAPPAPCFGGVTEVSIRIIDAILGALAPVTRDLAGAGSYGTCINFSGGGFDSERGESFGFYFFIEGGWGACAWRDGWNCTPNPTSNYNDYPVEWIETTLPIRYREVRLNTDSGGPGRCRGGVGTVRTIEVIAESIEINSLGERFIVPPFGLEGGDPGACNGVYMRTGSEGRWETVREALGTASASKFYGVTAGYGTWFRMVSGGGGGFGSALERPPESVVDDVVLGLVSRTGACRDYGVLIVEREDGRIDYDEAETEKLRAVMLGAARPRQEERTGIVARILQRTGEITLTPQAQAEVTAVERRLREIQGVLQSAENLDPTAPKGRSLRIPFLNDRALKYWDADSIDRWIARHGFQMPRVDR